MSINFQWTLLVLHIPSDGEQPTVPSETIILRPCQYDHSTKQKDQLTHPATLNPPPSSPSSPSSLLVPFFLHLIKSPSGCQESFFAAAVAVGGLGGRGGRDI